MEIDPNKNGNHWNEVSPEDRMEWVCSMCPVIRKLNGWDSLDHKGVYNGVNRIYSDPANLEKIIFEVVAESMKSNKMG